MSTLFPSFSKEDEKSQELDKEVRGSLFHSIEYELSGIIKIIDNIENVDKSLLKDIIIRQHAMILNYDLFLASNETRSQALKLFTNPYFLDIFIDVIGLIELNQHERVCLNKLAYDYYILPDKNMEVADKLYRLTTAVNGNQVVVLSGMIGLKGAQVLSMIRNSSFRDEKIVHRVNTFLIKSIPMYSVHDIIEIYCYLFDRFTSLFLYTMVETRPAGLTNEQYTKFDNISIAMLDILESLSDSNLDKILYDYGFTLSMVSPNTPVRFSLKTAVSYPRLQQAIKRVELNTGYAIP